MLTAPVKPPPYRRIIVAAAVVFVLAAVAFEPLRWYLLAIGLCLFVPAILAAAWPTYKRTLITVAVIFALSFWLMGGFLAGLLLLLTVLFLFVPACLWSAFTNRQRAGMQLHRIGIYLFAFVAMLVQDQLLDQMAQRHAVQIDSGKR